MERRLAHYDTDMDTFFAKVDLSRCVLRNIHEHVLHASTLMDVTLHNTNIATLTAFIKRRHNMTSSYDWPCSLQIYSTQMPHARCRIRANIRTFCGHPRQSNFRRILCLPASIYSTHLLRIYASTHLHFRRHHIRGTHTHLHRRFRCRRHDNTRELNRTDATNNNDFDARGGTKHTLNCRRSSRDGRSRGGQIEEQHVRHDHARPTSTYVRSPNMSISISQFWELPFFASSRVQRRTESIYAGRTERP